MVAKFFDPHPGLAGCTEPLPELVRLLAASLDGQERDLDEVVEQFRRAGPDDGHWETTMPGEWSGSRSPDYGMIRLAGGLYFEVPVRWGTMTMRMYNWGVIKFREVAGG